MLCFYRVEKVFHFVELPYISVTYTIKKPINLPAETEPEMKEIGSVLD
jgi:hypothetical protein